MPRLAFLLLALFAAPSGLAAEPGVVVELAAGERAEWSLDGGRAVVASGVEAVSTFRHDDSNSSVGPGGFFVSATTGRSNTTTLFVVEGRLRAMLVTKSWSERVVDGERVATTTVPVPAGSCRAAYVASPSGPDVSAATRAVDLTATAQGATLTAFRGGFVEVGAGRDAVRLSANAPSLVVQACAGDEPTTLVVETRAGPPLTTPTVVGLPGPGIVATALAFVCVAWWRRK